MIQLYCLFICEENCTKTKGFSTTVRGPNIMNTWHISCMNKMQNRISENVACNKFYIFSLTSLIHYVYMYQHQ